MEVDLVFCIIYGFCDFYVLFVFLFDDDVVKGVLVFVVWVYL